MSAGAGAETLTFLLTDVVGSLRHWERDAAAMRQALRRHDELVVAAVTGHGGRHLKERGEGDSHVAVFRSARDAVRAACALQLAQQAERWPDAEPIQVRVAIHSGNAVDEREGDFYGPVVSRCGRVRDSAYGGQTLVTEATYDLAAAEIPEPIRLLPLGQHRFRDLLQPLRIYQLAHPDLPADFPPIRSIETVPNNLPVQSTAFTGRVRELATVTALLDAQRLVTLTGVGGCGKTRLALQVLAQSLDVFPDGVWYVDLAPLQEPAQVARAMAAVLRVPDEPGRPLSLGIAQHLRQRTELVMLDNCEHLIDACAALLDDLLRLCGPLRVLATSREAMQLPGEAVYHVPPLDTPPARERATPASLLRHDAVRLFLDRARRRSPRLVLGPHNAEAIAHLCRRLGGLPLAIEIAAAHVDTLSLDDLSRQLDVALEWLPDRHRCVHTRHRTMAAAIQWSYDLLSEGERSLFDRASVFAGGFTLTAAQAVACSEGDAAQAHAAVEQLVGKSMISVDLQSANEIRFRVLEPLRAFGRERLTARGEWDTVARCHAAWLRELTEAAAAHLAGPRQAETLDQLALEQDNLRAALTWCLGAGEIDTGLRIAVSTWRFWQARAALGEGRDYLERLLAAADGAFEPALCARAERAAGNLAYYQGDMQAARRHYEAALAGARRAGLLADTAALLNNLALLALTRGEARTATVLLTEALGIRRRTGDVPGQVGVLCNLGLSEWYRGEWANAEGHLHEAVALARDLGDAWSLAAALTALGTVLHAHGQLPAARAAYAEALTARRGLDDLPGVAETSCALAALDIACGDLSAARDLCTDAMTIAMDDADEWTAADAHAGLAVVALEMSQADLAAEHFEACLALARAQGRQYRMASALHGLGHVAAARGDLDQASAHYEAALELRCRAGQRQGIAETSSALARLCCAKSDAAGAADWARAALAEYMTLGDPLGLAEALESQAALHALRGEAAPALKLAAVADGARQRLGIPRPASSSAFLAPYLATARRTLGAASARRCERAARGLDSWAVARECLAAASAVGAA